MISILEYLQHRVSVETEISPETLRAETGNLNTYAVDWAVILQTIALDRIANSLERLETKIDNYLPG